MNASDLMICQWNTGNGYTVHGQRIGAVLLANGGIVFSDIDRGINGYIPPEFEADLSVKERVMHGYMHTEVEYWRVASYFSDEAFQLYDDLEQMARAAARKAAPINTIQRW